MLRSATAFLDTVRYQPSSERTRFSGGFVDAQLPAQRLPPDLPRAPQSDRQHHGSCAVPSRWAASMSPPRWRRSSTTGSTLTAYIPGYLTVPGCTRARRYLAVEGQPKYLTVYEFENAGVRYDTPEDGTVRVPAIHGTCACGHTSDWTRLACGISPDLPDMTRDAAAHTLLTTAGALAAVPSRAAEKARITLWHAMLVPRLAKRSPS